jgi:hypothetical protein
LNDPSKGVDIFEDFKNALVGKETASGSDFTSSIGNVVGVIPWYIFCETTKLVDAALTADEDGVFQILGDTADQDVTCITSGDNVIGSFKTPTIGITKKFWFEARFKVNTVVASARGVYIGLAQPGEAKNAGGVFGGDAAALADVDQIGFVILEGDTDALVTAYNEAGAGTAQSSAAGVVVADTYIRAGFKLVADGSSIKIRFFVNGVDLGDDAAIDIGSTNANFPSATDMAITLSQVGGTGAESDDALSIDWVRIAQDF